MGVGVACSRASRAPKCVVENEAESTTHTIKSKCTRSRSTVCARVCVGVRVYARARVWVGGCVGWFG